ncbi:fasciclin domain-containing protein [Lacibacter sp.]|uniref:fasciclin domain-containing protein n=1 Tax=Lacibacter sp. TaxID=1915409 RepID=UPI002B4B6556|nr:fasciclin domain-containing protein [Lacibacter sp.]HLP36543.1 fasciclin domain-containing protein [Lacibacter sp.]
MKRSIIYLTIILGAGIIISSCNKTDDAPLYPTLSSYLQSQSDLSLFAAALDRAGLQSFKDGPGPFTWFAPNNDAFAAAGITLDSINKMKAGDISYLLMYHLVNASFASNEMVAQNSFPRTTQLGVAVYIGRKGADYFVNGSRITSIDNRVSNGYVHKINRINLPPLYTGTMQAILTKTGQHSLFIAALTRANRWAALNTTAVFTILAPTDNAMTAAGLTSAAIAAAPVARVDSIVRYHYFSSVRLFSNDFGTNVETPQTALGAGKTITSLESGNKLKGKTNATPVNVTVKDILGSNGVVHIIDGVLSY